MDKIKTVLHIGQGLMLLNAAIWVLVTVVYLLQVSRMPISIQSFAAMTGTGMLAYGGILAFLGFKLGKQQKIYFISSALLLGVSIVLTFLDQVGAADLLALIPPAFTLIYLLVNRNVFNGRLTSESG